MTAPRDREDQERRNALARRTFARIKRRIGVALFLTSLAPLSALIATILLMISPLDSSETSFISFQMKAMFVGLAIVTLSVQPCFRCLNCLNSCDLALDHVSIGEIELARKSIRESHCISGLAPDTELLKGLAPWKTTD